MDCRAVIAIVAREHNGMVVDGAAFRAGMQSVYMAEAESFRCALRLAARNGWARIVVESDSKAIIQELENDEEDELRWDTIAIIQDMRVERGSFVLCYFVWIRRSLNSTADYVAKKVLHGECPYDWFVNSDGKLVRLISNDQ